VPVDDGAIVKAGQVVARQRSLDVEKEIARLEGEIRTNEERILGVNLQLNTFDEGQGRQSEMVELSNQLNQLHIVAGSLRKQLAIVEQKNAMLDITSPIDGKVVTWKVRDLILNRPVKTGTRLMEIADPSKDWELEIDVPEAKVGHAIRYLRKIREDDPDAQLEVEFMLFVHTGIDLRGHVVRIESSAEIAGEKGNTVRMDVAFDQQELLKLLPGATETSIAALQADPAAAAKAIAELKDNLKVGGDMRAKIYCGRAPVGYVLFHDLWEFIQSRILFRF
jgi:hypothetical protein